MSSIPRNLSENKVLFRNGNDLFVNRTTYLMTFKFVIKINTSDFP